MSNILTLTSIFIKNGIFPSNSKNSTKTKKDRSVLTFFIVFIIYFALFFIPVMLVTKNIVYNNGYEDVFLSFLIPTGALTSIMLGVFSIISVFYFNKDSVQLLPLPIKSGELLIAKLLTSLIPQYLILMMFIFPGIFGIGMGMQAGFSYYIYSVLICLLMPIIPSIITSIVVMLLNKVFNFNKRKDLFMYIMTGIVLVFSLGYGFIIGETMDMNSEILNSFMTGNKEQLLKISTYLFPLFNSATISLLEHKEFIGLAAFITFIGLNILGIGILYLLSDRLYIKGLTMDRGRNKNKEDVKYKESNIGVNRLLLKKEWTNVKRTPVYMLNIVIVNLIFLIPFFIAIITMPREVSDYINFNNAGIYFMICAGVLLFINMGGNMASGSAFSRDGKSAIYLKSLPIEFKKVIDMKVLFSFIIDTIFALILQIPLLIYFKAPFYYFFLINIPILLTCYILNYIGVLIDLKKPNLTWSDESEPIKQSLSSFLNFLLNLIIVAILGLMGYFIYQTSFNLILAFFLFTIIVIVCYILLVLYVKKNQVKLFNKVG